MKTVIVSPVDLDARTNGLTLPLRELAAACGELGSLEWIVPRPASPAGRIGAAACLSRGNPVAVVRSAIGLPRSEVAKGLRRHDPDVVLAYLGTTAYSIPSEWRKRTFVVVQDSLTRIGRLNPPLTRLGLLGRLVSKANSRLVGRYERREYSRFGALQVTTRAEADYLEGLGLAGGPPIVVNPNGVHPAAGRRRLYDERRYDFISAGDFLAPRARQIAYRGIAVATRSSPCRYVVAGWSANRVDDPGGGLDLTRLEAVDDLREVLASARLMVCLDNNATGIKNSVLEACVEGVVVLANQSVADALPPGLVEVVGSEGQAADRAQALLADAAEWDRVSATSVRIAERDASWRSYRRCTQAALRALVSSDLPKP